MDLVAIMNAKMADIEEDGYSTEKVLVPGSKCHVLTHKIKKLTQSINPANPNNLVDLAAFKFDEATKIETEKVKAQIELLKDEIKKHSYKFILRGFPSKVYTELYKTIDNKIKALKEGETPEDEDGFTVQLLISANCWLLF